MRAGLKIGVTVLVALVFLNVAGGPVPASPGRAATPRAPGPAADAAAVSRGPDGGATSAAPINPGATTGDVTVHAADIADPLAIATGPDGNLWFTGDNAAIGRMTPAGAVTLFHDAAIEAPAGIVAGPDGAMWFTNTGGNSIGRITMAGAVSFFTAPQLFDPMGIAVGADGALWFTTVGSIGRITTAGAITLFSSPPIYGPQHIAAGPDGALWFTGHGTTIGRITTAGVITPFDDSLVSEPAEIVAGPDGAMWFTNVGNGASGWIGRITMAGVVSKFLPAFTEAPHGITAGPDGNLWYTGTYHASIGRMTPTGTVTLFTGTQQRPWSITPGPDGALWFVNVVGDSVGRVSVAGVISDFPGNGIADPSAIATGADGNLWFTNDGSATIASMTPAGVVTRYADPAMTQPRGIGLGPDGNVWFGASIHTVGRVTPAGVLSFFTSPYVFFPSSFAAGPDGNMWFTNTGDDSIGRITMAGAVLHSFTDPSLRFVDHIVAGAGGDMWFTQASNGADDGSIGRISMQGFVTTYGGSAVAGPLGIALGVDGAMWFTNKLGPIGKVGIDGTVTSVFTANGRGPIVAGADGNMWFASGAGISRATSTGTVLEFPYQTTYLPAMTTGPDGNVWFADFANDAIGRMFVTGVPWRPYPVFATAANQAVTLTWTSSQLAGDQPVTNYTFTATPGGAQCVWSSGPLTCTMSGLDGGVSYTIAATATNANGTSDVTTVGPVTPWSGSTLVPLVPARLLDSRTTNGGWNGPLFAGTPRPLLVAGRGGVALSATAVVLNVTATGGSAGSYLTVWAAGAPQPTASSINFAKGQTLPNQVVATVGAGGKIMLANAVGSVDVVVDVVGYYFGGVGDQFHALAPVRFLDSRTSVGGWSGPLGAGDANVKTLTLRGKKGVAISASSVVMNVTVTNATSPSFLQVWPSTAPRPNSSNLNFGANQTIANMVTSKVGTDGSVSFYNAAGATDVIVDVVGYYDRVWGLRYHALPAPVRVLDDRTGVGATGPWGPALCRTVTAAGAAVPANASAIYANVTATNGTAGSYLAIYPTGVANPGNSTVNFGPSQTIANLALTKLSSAGQVDICNAAGSVDVVMDVSGYFLSW